MQLKTLYFWMVTIIIGHQRSISLILLLTTKYPTYLLT